LNPKQAAERLHQQLEALAAWSADILVGLSRA
jgi:hypothetical protein